MRRPLSRHTRRLAAALFAAAALFCFGGALARAQSTDIAYPAPVFSNEIAGRITPRDVGDARLTRHFYLFKGTEGDVTVAVESAQLNGDVDLFVARTLRPLLKVTMFGGTTATRATKSVYLRREETLILRVEARAVGDAEGSYRVLLGGSFAPAPPELAQQTLPGASTASPESAPRPGTRRVTSTGARIDEPPAAVAEATPTPEQPPAETARNEETMPATREPARNSRRNRNTRGTTNRRRAPAARPTPTPSQPSADETAARPTGDTPKTDGARPADETATTTPAERPPASSTRRRSPRNTNRRRAPSTPSSDSAASSSTDAAPAAPPPAVTITRLVILTKDGQTLERAMDSVRRVTIENNQIVVTLRDGKVLRTPLANVEKMSFEP